MSTDTTEVPADATPVDEAPAKGKKGKKAKKAKGEKRSNLVPALVVAVGLVIAAYLMKPQPSSAGGTESTTTTTVAEGATVALEPMTLNLADGKYIRVGAAVTLAETADPKEFEEGGETNKLKDLIIFNVGDLTAEDLSTNEGREHLKETLAAGAKKLYGEEYLELYLTDLVIQ